MDDGGFPSILKFSFIFPRPKAGGPSDISNYRPISIQSHLSKIFEKTILSKLQTFVYKVIIDEQHGFYPGCSTTICNILFTNYAFNTYQQRLQVDVL